MLFIYVGINCTFTALFYLLFTTGLYRVNYDENNWQLLASVLNSPDYIKIDPMNRVQILADCLELAWRGDLG